jgi:hypothetical protein
MKAVVWGQGFRRRDLAEGSSAYGACRSRFLTLHASACDSDKASASFFGLPLRKVALKLDGRRTVTLFPLRRSRSGENRSEPGVGKTFACRPGLRQRGEAPLNAGDRGRQASGGCPKLDGRRRKLTRNWV